MGRHRTTTMGYDRYIYNITTQSSIGAKKITLWIDDIKTNESFEYKGIKYRYEWCMANNPIRQELERNINDIQLEAKDMGYGVSHGWIQDPYVWIGMKLRGKKKFDLEELSDTIERLKDYLISQGFEIEVLEMPNQIYIYFNYPGEAEDS